MFIFKKIRKEIEKLDLTKNQQDQLKVLLHDTERRFAKRALYLVLFGCVFAYDSALVLGLIDAVDKAESILFNVMAIYGLLKSFKDDKT